MLIISRPRQQSPADVSAVASDGVLSIPFLYDLPADSPLLERLRHLPEPARFVVPIAPRAARCLLDYLQIPYSEVLETADVAECQVEYIDEETRPRWYPVIDRNKCIACLECVNYCIFGVYSIGEDSRPFVVQPDACRDGCPACARVCPNGSIMFPLYEDRVIAGYEDRPPDELKDLVDLVDQI